MIGGEAMHWGRSGGNTRTSDEACLGTSYSAKLSAERRRGWDHQARRRALGIFYPPSTASDGSRPSFSA